jgi:type II secretory pathway component PulF
MLTSLNRHLELAGHTRRIIFEAVSYPAVIFVLGAIIITLVFTYIVPQFAPVFQEMIGGKLNPITQGVLDLAQNVVPFWIGVGLLVAGVVALFMALASSPGGRRIKEGLLLRIPVIGRLYHNSVHGRGDGGAGGRRLRHARMSATGRGGDRK